MNDDDKLLPLTDDLMELPDDMSLSDMDFGEFGVDTLEN